MTIKGIAFDSRKVKKDYIFFAIDGTRNLGTDYVDEAIDKGAAVIVSSKKIKNYNNKLLLSFFECKVIIIIKDVWGHEDQMSKMQRRCRIGNGFLSCKM